MLNAANIAQILMSGLLMGLIYALIAAGLSLIFGLMDVVNFAHGEFLMTAMYATFGLVVLLSLDPLILSPIVAAVMFVVGAFCYRAIIVHAMRARTNVGMAGAILSIFYYIHPDVGGPFALIAYVTVALGGFGSVFGALAAGVIVGIVEAISATVLQPSMKAIGIYGVYLLVVFLRPRGLFGHL